MAFSRSVTSLLRTSRHVVTPARGVNPVTKVWGHDRFGARTYAAVFERTKPHVNIGKWNVNSAAGLVVLIVYRHHWSRRSRKGKFSAIPIASSAHPSRPPSLQPSRKDKQRRDLHSS